MKKLSEAQLNRRARLLTLIEDHGSAAELAKALGLKSQSRISHMLGAKGMGEKAARDIERRLQKDAGWMDSSLDGRKPAAPEYPLLARIIMAVNRLGPKLTEKKQIQITIKIYNGAKATGVISEEEISSLIAIAE